LAGKKAASSERELGYIIGLPADDPEAELARTKFERVVERLATAYPGLREARATVKIDSSKGDRKHFEVEVFILMQKDRATFKEDGWSLPEVFDIVSSRLKRLMTKAESKPAYQRHKTRGERETSNPEELGLG
jgi:ribosome-associated translation inhibitor RaiA